MLQHVTTCYLVLSAGFAYLTVFISYGYYNKISQTWWLRKTEKCSFTVMEARSSKSIPGGQNQGVDGALFPLEVFGKHLLLVESLVAVAFLNFQLHHFSLCLHGHAAFSCLSSLLCLPLINVIVLKAYVVKPG